VVVGGGFIGVELAENLVERGIDCTLVELTDQIMPPFDPDMTVILEDHMRKNGVKLFLGKGIEAISEEGSTVQLNDGILIQSDMTLLCTGVRPNNELAKAAGLELGPRGHIVADQAMRTSDPAIYAVGDVIEVDEPLLGGRTAIPLAGPANRQGRAVCANLLAEGTVEPYRGSIGTSIAKVFDLTAASTGINEKQLQAAGLVFGRDYFYSLVHPMHHVGYYPGALPMVLKLLFHQDGRVLGAQIIGYEGVDKRIDVISTAIHFKGTVRDLAELELAYAPPYGAAKDPVNFAGFVAENILAGLTDPVTVSHYFNNPDRYTLLDTREEVETAANPVKDALKIPLSQLRQRLGELDKGIHYLTFCATGLRGYVSERILKQQGFTVSNLMGGLRTMDTLMRKAANENEEIERDEAVSAQYQAGFANELSRIHDLDVGGMSCPGPIVEIGKFIKELEDGEFVRVRATDPGFSRDIASWCENTGNTLLKRGEKAGVYTALVQKGERALSPAASGFVSSGDPTGKDKT
ncbi:MAG: FAD-dependent oxidoreductase, partial [Clostridiaceae bacterium]|nr:FAD-dependent oxidoreductase [Clostridiaceae bacterium]